MSHQPLSERLTEVLTSNAPAGRVTANDLLILLALGLALPLPIPLTNALPAPAIVLIAVSMMEEDGGAIFSGYLMTLVTVAYFLFCAGAIRSIFLRGWEFATRMVFGSS